MSSNDGTLNPELDSSYNYIPSRNVAIVFVVLFGVSSVVHIFQAVRSRLWWLFPTICIAGIVEVAGWSGRLWSSFNPSNSNAFMLQICATILAPTPMVAANFVILGRIINRLGTPYSRLPPAGTPSYSAPVFVQIFMNMINRGLNDVYVEQDFISLIVQGTGGGMAASAETDPTPGGNVMLGGIIFQLATITVYALFAIEFFVRYFLDKPLLSRKASTDTGHVVKPLMGIRLKLMSGGLGFSTICLFIRAVYRTIELADGWNGRIISTELYFNVLDGAMIVLAIYTMNFAHPGVLLHHSPRQHSQEGLSLKEV